MTSSPEATVLMPSELSAMLVKRAVEAALLEDMGDAGDITSDATLPADLMLQATFVARKAGSVAGLALAQAAFASLDPAARFERFVQDGAQVQAGTPLAHISGNARAVLKGERVALNYLCRLCGIATLTRRYVDAIAGTKARIIDTRKTTPGLRAFEKYAVRVGGGMNHRFGLYDAVLIKDNHIAAAGGIDQAVSRARAHVGHLVKIEVEVDSLEQLDEVLHHKIDAVLLDNMQPAQLAEAVRRIGGRVLSEASGGVSLDTVRAIAQTGVDLISVGALTHSAPILDVGLDILG